MRPPPSRPVLPGVAGVLLGCTGLLPLAYAAQAGPAAQVAPTAQVAPIAQTPAPAAASASAAATALDRYLEDLRSLRTDFTQTVSDAQGRITQGGSGSLIVQRPDRFRWDYRPYGGGAAGAGSGAGNDAGAGNGAGGNGAGGGDQEGQLLVADGRNVWFFDRELAQVTVKPIDAALSSTPIMLLSGSVRALRAQFEITPQPMADGLQWVQVRPRSADADFSEARLGFRGNELARMIVHNMLGETVQLDFSHSQRNAPVDASAFNFTVPKGVDLIGTPVGTQTP